MKTAIILMLAAVLSVPAFASGDVVSGVRVAKRGTVSFVKHPALLTRGYKASKVTGKTALVVTKDSGKVTYKVGKRILL